MNSEQLAYAASALSGPLLLAAAAFACLLLPLFIKALRGTQGIMALSAMDDKGFAALLAKGPALKTGRPGRD